MKQSLATVSFSVNKELAEDLDRLASQEKRSKSEVFREMFRRYKLDKTLDDLAAQARPIAEKYGLYTDDDVARFMREN